jgi:nucleotide-binding universal stress UspA family protein
MTNRWLIGLSLSSDELGPLELGAWLHEATGARLDAVHVAIVPTLPQRYFAELEQAFREVAERQIADVGLTNQVSSAEVRLGRNVAHDLVERATELGAGLLVGRCAPRSSPAIVRLGRVARRVLRHLPGVVGVAPPDLKRKDIGSGPVLLAIEPESGCDSAVEFARSLSAATGRELLATHVADEAAAVRFLPADLPRRYRASLEEQAKVALDAFVKRHELADVRVLQAGGSAVEQLLELSRREQASAIVCGSRRLSAAERIFEGSIGSALAANAEVPVFVVPQTS